MTFARPQYTFLQNLGFTSFRVLALLVVTTTVAVAGYVYYYPRTVEVTDTREYAPFTASARLVLRDASSGEVVYEDYSVVRVGESGYTLSYTPDWFELPHDLVADVCFQPGSVKGAANTVGIPYCESTAADQGHTPYTLSSCDSTPIPWALFEFSREADLVGLCSATGQSIAVNVVSKPTVAGEKDTVVAGENNTYTTNQYVTNAYPTTNVTNTSMVDLPECDESEILVWGDNQWNCRDQQVGGGIGVITNALALDRVSGLTSTVNGVAANVAIPTGILQELLGYDAAGNPVYQSVSSILSVVTTNTLASAINSLTSTVNGIPATANIINSNTLGTATNTLTSTVNGVAATAPIVSNNTLTNSANTLTSSVNGVISAVPVVTANTLGLTRTGGLSTAVNGVAANVAVPLGTALQMLAFDAAGNPVYQSVTSVLSGNTTNTLAINRAGGSVSTVNGIASTVAEPVGVIQEFRGFNAAGAPVYQSVAAVLTVATTVSNTSLANAFSTTVNGVTGTTVPIINSSTLGSATNTLTSTINGVVATAPIVNSHGLSVSAGNLQSTVNGVVASTPLTALYANALGGNLTQAGPITVVGGSGAVLGAGATIDCPTCITTTSTALTGDVVAGTGVSLSGTATDRLVGSTNLTIGIDPATIAVATTNSITGNGSTGTPLQLTGDVATPGNGFFYGTSGAGVKGWQNLAAAVSSATTNTNGLTRTGGLTNTVNGVVATTTIPSATLQELLGFDAAGNPVYQSVASILGAVTTNVLSSATNTMTSNVNGIVATAPIINSLSNTSAVNTLSTTANGVTGAGVTIINSNVIGSVANTLSSTINGVLATANIINTNTNGLTRAGGLVTVVNGVSANTTIPTGTVQEVLGYDTTGSPVYQSVATLLSGATTNTFTANQATGFTSTVNGVVSAVATPASTISNFLGYDTAGNPVYQSVGSLLSGSTTNTLASAANTLTSTVNGVVATSPLVNSNTFIVSRAGGSVSTVNGVSASQSEIIDTIQEFRGFNAAGAPVYESVASVLSGATTVSNTSAVNALSTTVNGVTGTTVPIINSNTLGSATNTLTSTINGVVATSSIINSNALTVGAGNLTSTVNGVATNIPLVNLFANANGGDLTSTTPAVSITGGTGAVLGGGATVDVASYVGATNVTAGTAGLVNPAAAGEQNFVYTGAGTWVAAGAPAVTSVTPGLGLAGTLPLGPGPITLDIGAGNGISVNANDIAINAPTCIAGEYLSWNGTAFQCIVTTNVQTLSRAGGLSSTVNGVASNVALPAGTLQEILGYDTAGNPIYQSVGGVLAGATTNTLGSAINTLTSTVNGVVATSSIVNSNTFAVSRAGGHVSTVNGVVATQSEPTGTIQEIRGFDAAGNPVYESVASVLSTATTVSNTSLVNGLSTTVNGVTGATVPIINSNTLGSAVNTLTSTINGVVATSNIINSNTNGLTRVGGLVNTVNGVVASTAIPTGTLQDVIGYDAAGNAVYESVVSIVAGATTNTLSSAVNTLTSTVNGVVATSSIVNSISNTSSTNTLTTTVNGVTGAGVPIINSNTFVTNRATGSTSTVNGVAATQTEAASTVQEIRGFDAAGNPVYETVGSVLAGATTNTLGSATNTLTSTVNGVVASSSIVNSNVLGSAANTLTSTVNGVAGAGVSIINSNANGLTRAGGLTSAVNGITASTTIASGTADELIGYDTAGNAIYQSISSILSANTTNTKTWTRGAGLTSTVNGVAANVTPATGTVQEILGYNAAGAPVYQTPASILSASTTNTFTANQATGFTSTVNGVTSTVATPASIISNFLGYDTAGDPVYQSVGSVLAAATTVSNTSLINTLSTTVNGVTGATVPLINSSTLGSAVNTLTSTINGVVATSSIINSNALGSVANTLTSTVNGVATTTPIINSNTLTWTEAAGLTSTVNGIAATFATPAGTVVSVIGYDATGAPVKQTLSSLVTANNGLTINPTGNVQLGGTLIQDTTIDQAGFNLNFNSTFGTLDTSIQNSANIVGSGTAGVGFVTRDQASPYSNYLFSGNGSSVVGASDILGGNPEIAQIATGVGAGSAYAGVQASVVSGSSSEVTVDGNLARLSSTNGVGNSNFATSPTSIFGTIYDGANTQNIAFTPTAVRFDAYPSTRNDSGAFTPVNFLYTDAGGTVLSSPISALASLNWSLTGNAGTDGGVNNFLGTTDAQALAFRTNNFEQMRITSGGFVGIGTSTPATELHLAKTTTGGYDIRADSFGQQGTFIMNRSSGSFASPTRPASGAILGTMGFGAYDSGSFFDTAYMRAAMDATTGVGDLPTALSFYTTLDGTTTPLERLRITNAGRIGIGTGAALPAAFLQYVNENGTGESAIFDRYSNTSSLQFRTANGTLATPTAVTANQRIMRLAATGYNGTAFVNNRATIEAVATETWAGTANGTALTFSTTPTGSNTLSTRMRIDNDGSVGIGTNTPTNRLHVSGVINPVRFEGLQTGVVTDDLVVADATGVLRTISAAALLSASTTNTFTATQATGLTSTVNGIVANVPTPAGTINNILGYDVSGNPVYQPVAALLTAATTVSNTSAANTISTTVNGVTGATVPIINSSTLGSAVNTLTTTINGVVATAPIVNSISNTSTVNTLTTTVNGVAGTGVPIINSNALGSTANTLTSTVNGVGTTASIINSNANGLTRLGGLTNTVNGVVATTAIPAGAIQEILGFNAAGDPIYQTIAGVLSGATTNAAAWTRAAGLSSTVNGVVANVTPTAGTIQEILGYDAAGLPVYQTPAAVLSAATTNTLGSAVNTLTSTVNGVAATGSIINSNVVTWTQAAGLTSTVNGVSSTVATPAGTLATILGYDSTGAPVRQALSALTTTADNGLTINPTNNVQLGGTLIQDTVIADGSFNLGLGAATFSGIQLFSLGSSNVVQGNAVTTIGFNHTGGGGDTVTTIVGDALNTTNSTGSLITGGNSTTDTIVNSFLGVRNSLVSNINNANIFAADSSQVTNTQQSFVVGNSGSLIDTTQDSFVVARSGQNVADVNTSNILSSNGSTTAVQGSFIATSSSTVNNVRDSAIFGIKNNFDDADGIVVMGRDNNNGGIAVANGSIIGNSNQIVNTNVNNFGILGSGNVIDANQGAYIVGTGIVNNTNDSVQIGTQDSTKTTIDSSGRVTFRGALAPNGNDGNSGEFLISQGAGNVPAWGAIGSSAVTSVTPGAGIVGTLPLGPGAITLNVGAGNGITVNANDIAINAPTCLATQRLSWNGSAFSCVTTTNTLGSAVNTLTSTVNGVVATSSLINSNTFAISRATGYVSTINGVAATQSEPTGTIQEIRGFNAAGAPVYQTIAGVLSGATTVSNTSSVNALSTTVNGVTGATVPIINSNVLGSAVNTLTSTVNGVGTTTSIVNSISNTSTANTLLTTVNGVAGTTVAIINSNTLGYVAGTRTLTSTVNGVVANQVLPLYVGATGIAAGVSGLVNPAAAGEQAFLYQGAGTWISPTALLAGATTHTLGSAVNTLTSTVNGVAATSPIVNSISNTSAANTISTTVNGVTGTGVSIINSNVLGSAVNTLTSTVNGVGTTASIINSNTLAVSRAGGSVSTVNGVVSTQAEPTGTIQEIRGFNAAGAPVYATIASVLSGATTVSNTSATNTLSTTVNGVTGTGVNIINSNTNAWTRAAGLTNTTNGVAANITPATGTIQEILGYNAAGAPVYQTPASLLSASTTNTLGSAVNTLTSTVNGVAATSPIVNSISNTSAVNALSTTVNGVAGTSVTIINSNTLGYTAGTRTLTSTVNGVAATQVLPLYVGATGIAAGVSGLVNPAAAGEQGFVYTGAGTWVAPTVPISSLTAAIATNNIDNLNFNQAWNWNTATTQTGLSLAASSLTTGGVLSISSTNAAHTGSALTVSDSGTASTALAVTSGATTGNGMTITAASLTTGNALRIAGPTDSSTASDTMLRVRSDATQGYNKPQVVIGSGDTNTPDTLARDQLYVFGRINTSWNQQWADCLSGASTANGTTAGTLTGDAILTSSTNNAGTITYPSATGVSGICRLTSPATVSYQMTFGSNTVNATEPVLNPVMEARVFSPTSTTQRGLIGFSNRVQNTAMSTDATAVATAATNFGTSGVFFRKNAADGNWSAVTANGGTATTTNIAAATTNAWHRFRIEIDSVRVPGTPEARFYVDGTLVATHTTNLPTSATKLGYGVSNNTTTAAATTMDVDYMRVWSDDPPETNNGQPPVADVEDIVPPATEEPEVVADGDSTEPNTDATDNSDPLTPPVTPVVTSIEGSTDSVEAKLLVLNTNDQIFLTQFTDLLSSVALQQTSITELLATLTTLQLDVTALSNRLTAVETRLSQDISGSAQIREGDTEIEVTFDQEYAEKPVVILTPKDFIDGKYAVDAVTKTGFTIRLSVEQDSDVTFYWRSSLAGAAPAVSSGSSSETPSSQEPTDDSADDEQAPETTTPPADDLATPPAEDLSTEPTPETPDDAPSSDTDDTTTDTPADDTGSDAVIPTGL